jgi:hypothetical protein
MFNILHSHNYGVGVMAFPYLQVFSTIMSAVAAKKAAKAGQTDLTKLRNEANRAGFNPLTVLRATGGQGFNNTAALSSAAFMSAFSRLGNNIAEAKQQKATLDNTLVNTRYTGILADQAIKEMNSPAIMPGQSTQNGAVGKTAIGDGSMFVPEGGLIPKEWTEQFPPFLGDKVMTVSPIPSAEMMENQYGDLISWGYGPVKLVADGYVSAIVSGARRAAEQGRRFGLNNPSRNPKFRQNSNTTNGTGMFGQVMKWAFPKLQQN